MKNHCLKLALFILLSTTLFFLYSQKALAKDAYTFTWTVNATPSAVAIDSSNNVYYAGFLASGSAQMNPFYNLDRDNELNANQIATTGGIFLSEINGVAYKKTYFWQSDQLNGISLIKIATDSAQNVWILGSFKGTVNFNSTEGADFRSAGANNWAFLTEIKADGTYGGTYVWTDGNIAIQDMTVDKSDNIFLLGKAKNNNLAGDLKINLNPLGGSDVKTLHPGETLGFYSELLSGTSYAYGFSNTFRNTNSQYLEADRLALDLNGNVFIYGAFSGKMSFSGNTGNEKISSGGNDIFLSKYDQFGNYKTTYVLGGSDNESAGALGIDSSGNIYFSGGFNGTVNFNPAGGNDTKIAILPDQRFLTKLNPDGSYGYTLIWNSNSLRINKIAFDQNNQPYLVGISAGATNFDPIGATDSQNGFGGNDAFMTVLNQNGSYNYTYVWGGTNDEKAASAAFDSNGNFYVTGSTKSLSVNFDPTDKTSFPDTFAGGENGYLSEFSPIPLVSVAPVSTLSLALPENKAPVCTKSAPEAPTIFSIAANATQSTVNFIPSDVSITNYTISYGPSSDAEAFSVNFDYKSKVTPASYTINSLNANTVYYFKIRANNGCTPGAWSKTLGLKTPKD
jgi:hypothetical protein